MAQAFYKKRKLVFKKEAHLRAAVERLIEGGCHPEATLVDSLLESMSNSEDRV